MLVLEMPEVFQPKEQATQIPFGGVQNGRNKGDESFRI